MVRATMQRSTTSFSSLRASTLRVEVSETYVVDLPIIRPHLLSVATMQAQTLMIVKIVCSDGVTGFGEGTTIGGLSYGAESPEGMKLAIDRYIAPILESANPARVPETMNAIRKAIKGNNFAKCAVETALLDAWGKRTRSADVGAGRRAPAGSSAGRISRSAMVRSARCKPARNTEGVSPTRSPITVPSRSSRLSAVGMSSCETILHEAPVKAGGEFPSSGSGR